MCEWQTTASNFGTSCLGECPNAIKEKGIKSLDHSLTTLAHQDNSNVTPQPMFESYALICRKGTSITQQGRYRSPGPSVSQWRALKILDLESSVLDQQLLWQPGCWLKAEIRSVVKLLVRWPGLLLSVRVRWMSREQQPIRERTRMRSCLHWPWRRNCKIPCRQVQSEYKAWPLRRKFHKVSDLE